MSTNIRKRDIVLLVVSSIIILLVLIFCLIYWDIVSDLFKKVVSGTEIMKEYILSLGWVGIIAMMLIIIICFFFPFVSSLPVQLACGITYGLFKGTLIVSASYAIAAQLLFLFKQNFKLLMTKKQRIKQQELHKKIENSHRGIIKTMIIAYLVPFIPFLIISNVAASGLKYPKYFLFTTFGPILEVVVTLYLGQTLLSVSPVASIITLVGIICIVVLSIIFNDKIIDFVFVERKKENGTEN